MTTQEKNKFIKLFTLLTDYRTTSIFDWRIQSLVRDIRKHNVENNDKISQEEALVAIDMLISKYWDHPDTKPE